MRQTITRMNFDDEQTSCFMFKKIALQLLQQCDLGRSSVELSSQSFSLIVPLPKKTRVIMSRSGKLITQKIQFVTTGTANIGLTDALSWTEPLQTVEKYRVPCRARTSSEASLDQSVTFCETNGTSNHKWKWAKKSSQVCKGEMVSQFILHRDINCFRLALWLCDNWRKPLPMWSFQVIYLQCWTYMWLFRAVSFSLFSVVDFLFYFARLRLSTLKIEQFCVLISL